MLAVIIATFLAGLFMGLTLIRIFAVDESPNATMLTQIYRACSADNGDAACSKKISHHNGMSHSNSA